ncbi:MAG TPA: acyltransferase domain-containing protein [Propionibacteriaceae bacterium]|jgi:hypothetical protein|nr:acyltransferase domain-containing protein [Propionibacteriaceae bacterium]
MIPTRTDVRGRLGDPDLPDRLRALGFRPDDTADATAAAATVLDRPDHLELVATCADRLATHLGEFTAVGHPDVWSGVPVDPGGVLPMLTLIATAPDVAAWHARRGIPADISTASLSDLGQQVWVHRLTDGAFGLHTHGWLTIAWSGALYWLGRLQFNLQPGDDGWVLSTHIPRTGPLTPEAVDESFAAATRFFATYFPEYPTRDFVCSSWLLDPALAAALPHSNLAAFQRRWQLTDERHPGEADVLFFVFGRRGRTELDTLPRDTALRRAILDQLTAGKGWWSVTGRIPQ